MTVRGKLLKILKRALKNRSANQIARDADMDAAAVTRFVKGERDLTYQRVERLMDALDVDLTENGGK